jgi:hypothetical protein
MMMQGGRQRRGGNAAAQPASITTRLSAADAPLLVHSLLLSQVRVDIAQLPTPSVSASPRYVPVPTPSPFPSGMVPVDGAPLSLRDGLPFQFTANPYAITYFYFPVVPPEGPLPGLTGVSFSIDALYNDAEVSA